MEKVIVRVENMCQSYGKKKVIDDISIDVYEGEFLTILGPSGCGKTTILRAISGLDFIQSGKIMIDGVDVTYLDPTKREVNTIFQNYALFTTMSVEKNINFGLRMKHVGKEEIKKRTEEMLDLVKMGEFRNEFNDRIANIKDLAEALQEEIQQTKQLLQKSLQEIQCSRILQDYDFYTHWNHWNDEDFQWMMSKQIIFYDYVKYDMDYQKAYTSLYFMNTHLNQESLKRTVQYLFNDTRCGDVFRIKGFICENDQWFEMNATRQSMSLTPISIGQDVMIVIGEHLNKEEIQSYFHKKTS